MNRFSQSEIIEGFKRRDSKILRLIYKKGFPSVRQMIMKNRGTEDDAKDIFQESVIIAFRNFKEDGNFTIKCSLNTYIYSVARNLWLKHLRTTKSNWESFVENHEYIEFEEPEPVTQDELKFSLYQKAFLELPEDCQKILKLSLDGIPQKKIASILGYKSQNYISKRKHFCKEYLIKIIKEDPDFQSFK